ncbi:hypothetical protein [Deinococcus sp.]|uniref:hypothetical protein n=1 Tax=Deinococcus sp. TaxID=47478 RepID=UPI0025F95752|nr:hypothetical protein [Deinococcus sp.]
MTSALMILKLEDWRGESVVHVALDGLALKNPHAREGFSTSLGHTPVSETALRRCLSVLDDEHADLPDYESGYDNWKAAAEQGQGAHFAVDLAEIVESLEQALNSVQTGPERGLFRKVCSGRSTPDCSALTHLLVEGR